jgi:hypothetical protein
VETLIQIGEARPVKSYCKLKERIMKEEVVYDPASAGRPAVMRRISWAAIFAGLIIALVAELVLTVLGISIGATALNPFTADQSTAQGFGIGAAVWLIITSVVSLYFGGWVAGRLSGFVRGSEGPLHGLVTWGAVTLLAAGVVSAAASGIISGTAAALKSALPLAGQALSGENAQGGIGSGLQGNLSGGNDSVLEEIQNMSQGNTELVQKAGVLLKEAPNVKPEDRQAVVQILVSKNNMTQDQANQTVDRWIQSTGQAKTKAGQAVRQVSQAATAGVSAAGWWSFLVLVLSGLAAAWGGRRGALAFLHSRPAAEARGAA